MITCKEEIIWRVIRFYSTNGVSQIAHTQCVADYTLRIARKEGLDALQCDMLEIAAWLHDIGCPPAREKFGNARPVNQQNEGRALAKLWLDDYPQLTLEQKQWLCDVVGTHHQFRHSQRLNSAPVFEADIIVNFLEGYYKPQNLQLYLDSLIRTASGKELYNMLLMNS